MKKGNKIKLSEYIYNVISIYILSCISFPLLYPFLSVLICWFFHNVEKTSTQVEIDFVMLYYFFLDRIYITLFLKSVKDFSF